MSELQDLKNRIEMLESAVQLLEERLLELMKEQFLEPCETDIVLSEEDAQKLRDWLKSERNE
jgi:hypothetical protein